MPFSGSHDGNCCCTSAPFAPSPELELAGAAAFLIIGFAFFYDNGQGVDENVHYDQIVRLVSGDWSLNPVLTTLPGFHAIVAASVWGPGGATQFSVRLAVFGLSLATVGVCYALARALQPEYAVTRTIQFTLLPILFPQFFLIYTDVTSLLFVMLMMLAAVHRKYEVAGALGLVSCLVRQDNVIWVVFVVLWSYLRDLRGRGDRWDIRSRAPGPSSRPASDSCCCSRRTVARSRWARMPDRTQLSMERDSDLFLVDPNPKAAPFPCPPQ